MTYWRQSNIQPQGFDNPWMPGPDIGRGIRGLIDRLQQQKMYQQQLEQQQWERGITERQTAVEEKRAEPTPQKVPEFIQRMQTLLQANPEMTRGQAANEILKYKEPEAIPPVIPKDFEQRLVTGYGENWREDIPYDLFMDELDNWQIINRPKVPGAETETRRYRRQKSFTGNLLSDISRNIRLELQSKDPLSKIFGAAESENEKALKVLKNLAQNISGTLINREYTSDEEAQLRVINTIVSNLDKFMRADGEKKNQQPGITLEQALTLAIDSMLKEKNARF